MHNIETTDIGRELMQMIAIALALSWLFVLKTGESECGGYSSLPQGEITLQPYHTS